MLPFDSLLAPVSDSAVAGEDISASGVLYELETLAQGKPETQFSAAEEPDWKAVRKRALEIAETTRDLRAIAVLTAALLRTSGVPGLAAGLELLQRTLETFWDTVYPLLDASDDNDPSERVNAVANLAAPIGSDGDFLRILPGLRATPILVSPRAGRFTLLQYLAQKGKAAMPAGGGEAPTAELLAAAAKDTDPALLQQLHAAAEASLAHLKATQALFQERCGPTSFPSVEALRADLKELSAWLAPIASPDSAESSAETSGDSGGSEGGTSESSQAARVAPGRTSGGGAPLSGEVASREDVERALEAIITYYKTYEPSSPIPFLLQRVKRLVSLNFLELIRDLTPESMDKILSLTGPVDPGAE